MTTDRFSDTTRPGAGGVAPRAQLYSFAPPVSSGLRTHRAPCQLLLRATLVALLAACGTGCSAKPASTQQKLEAEGLAGAREGLPGEAAAQPQSGKPEIAAPLPDLEGEHFSAFDLLVNRPHAHRIAFAGRAPTIVVDATTPDFARYIHGNHANDWMLGAKLGGEVGAGVKARNAKLWLPVLRPETAQLLRLRVFNPAQWENKLDIKFNGKALATTSLKEGWQEVAIEVPVGAHLRADNQVELSFSNMGRIQGNLSGGAIAWAALGAADSETLAGAQPEAAQQVAKSAAEDVAKKDDGARADGTDAQQAGKATEPGGEKAADEKDAPKASPMAAAAAHTARLPLSQDALTLDAQTGLAWYVWLPDKAQLALDLKAPEGCGVQVGLFVEKSGDKSKPGSVVAATEVTRNLVLGRGEEQKTAVDLSQWAGQIARLEMRASDQCAGGDSLLIRSADLVVPGARPALPEGVKPPKRIVFWLMDTLRADHLPLGFDTDVRAPNLARLAEEGAFFKLAYVQGNESRTSHAAMFTGQYPIKNGLVGKGILHPHHYLLPEAIKDHKYRTGCHVANGYVSTNGGFAQGWDHFVNNLREGWGIRGEDVARHGLDWAKKNSEQPFFLYLGTIDPHVTYRAHAGITETYDTTPYNGEYVKFLSGEELGRIKGGKPVSERDKLRIKNLYKSEVTYSDKVFGDFRAQMEEAGLWEDTMVIITADHGEEFWEHGSVGHGHNVHQELVHVPLIMYYPPLIPAGTAVTPGVDIIDLYPTILEAIGAPRPKDLQGKSLLPLIHKVGGNYPEPAIATQYLIHYAMQMEQWKLYLKRGAYELYDRNADPLELVDVADQHPLASRWLLDSMGYFRVHRKEWNKDSWGAVSNLKPGFLERIKAE